MRKAEVYRNGILAGILLEEDDRSYKFIYDENYHRDATQPAISLTLPKTQQKFSSPYLFPFFYNMLSEGVNKKVQMRMLKIDEEDSFGLLLATAQFDTLGAVTVKPVEDK
ncbi:MAG: HipA N-terminal domain-containing protein [Bacteroidia bacterium]